MINKKNLFFLYFLLLILATFACSSDIRFAGKHNSYAMDSLKKGGNPAGERYRVNQVLTGTCSYYGKKFHGRKTANGEIYDMYAFTAAHKTLPFNTILLVENLSNGKKVQVRINDRGPYKKNRILDLSYSAAKKIDIIQTGTAQIKATIIKLGQ